MIISDVQHLEPQYSLSPLCMKYASTQTSRKQICYLLIQGNHLINWPSSILHGIYLVALHCPSPRKELRSAGSYAAWLVCLACRALVARCLMRPQFCSGVCVCYRFSPERSGDAGVSTQQFRHFHPETRTHLCLSVSWGLWFHTRLCSRSLSLPWPIHPAPVLQRTAHPGPPPPPPLPSNSWLPSHLTTIAPPLSSLCYWSQLEIRQHNRFWALSSSPQW